MVEIISLSHAGGITIEDVRDGLQKNFPKKRVLVSGTSNLPSDSLLTTDTIIISQDTTNVYKSKYENLQKEMGKKEGMIAELEKTLEKTVASIKSFHQQQQQLFEDFCVLRSKYDELKQEHAHLLWSELPHLHEDFKDIPPCDERLTEMPEQIGSYAVGDVLGEGQFATVKTCWYSSGDSSSNSTSGNSNSINGHSGNHHRGSSNSNGRENNGIDILSPQDYERLSKAMNDSRIPPSSSSALVPPSSTSSPASHASPASSSSSSSSQVASAMSVIASSSSTSALAIKVIEKAKIVSYASVHRIANEIGVLRELHHSSVVRVLDVLHSSSYLYIVTEKGGQDLFDFFDCYSEGLNIEWARQIIAGTLRAVRYIHANHVCHRDLKPENILLSFDADRGKLSNLKLCDFGLSARTSTYTLLTDFCGSPGFFAPEMITRGKYRGEKVDVWSIGCIAIELLLGHDRFCELWMCAYDYDLLQDKAGFEKEVSDAVDRVSKEIRLLGADIHDFVVAALTLDPNNRTSVDHLCRCPWIADLCPPSPNTSASGIVPSPTSSMPTTSMSSSTVLSPGTKMSSSASSSSLSPTTGLTHASFIAATASLSGSSSQSSLSLADSKTTPLGGGSVRGGMGMGGDAKEAKGDSMTLSTSQQPTLHTSSVPHLSPTSSVASSSSGQPQQQQLHSASSSNIKSHLHQQQQQQVGSPVYLQSSSLPTASSSSSVMSSPGRVQQQERREQHQPHNHHHNHQHHQPVSARRGLSGALTLVTSSDALASPTSASSSGSSYQPQPPMMQRQSTNPSNNNMMSGSSQNLMGPSGDGMRFGGGPPVSVQSSSSSSLLFPASASALAGATSSGDTSSTNEDDSMDGDDDLGKLNSGRRSKPFLPDMSERERRRLAEENQLQLPPIEPPTPGVRHARKILNRGEQLLNSAAQGRSPPPARNFLMSPPPPTHQSSSSLSTSSSASTSSTTSNHFITSGGGSSGGTNVATMMMSPVAERFHDRHIPTTPGCLSSPPPLVTSPATPILSNSSVPSIGHLMASPPTRLASSTSTGSSAGMQSPPSHHHHHHPQHQRQLSGGVMRSMSYHHGTNLEDDDSSIQSDHRSLPAR